MTMVWSPATTVMNSVTRHSASPKAALDGAQAAISKDVAGLRKK
jgi:maltose-binding protein MalE